MRRRLRPGAARGQVFPPDPGSLWAAMPANGHIRTFSTDST